MKLVVILLALTAFAQDEAEAKKPPKLTEQQRRELSAAVLAKERAALGYFKLKADFADMLPKAAEAADAAAANYAEVVKRLAKLVPDGYELKESGEIVAKPKPDAKPVDPAK